MVADVYSHIIDDDRWINAQRFEEQFLNTIIRLKMQDGYNIFVLQKGGACYG